ncbi:MAG: TMEM175 family protein [Betaproteobacteria bacterium]
MTARGKDHPPPPSGGFGTTRIEALADGIFAVAMTLLVLDVKLPEGESFGSSVALFDRLISLEHTFVIYFITFVVLAMFWVGHHAHFHYIRYVDHTLLWINLLFLFGVTSMPFATDLLGSHNTLVLPYLTYGAKVLMLSGLLVLQIVYLRRNPELAEPTLTSEIARRIIVRTAIFATIPILSMVAVFYNTRLALYLYFLLLVVHFLPGRVDMPGRSDRPGNH